MAPRSRRVFLPLALAALLALCLHGPGASRSTAAAPARQQDGSAEGLWIDMRVGPPLIALFNEAARDDDIARVDHPSQAGQLAAITQGKKMVIFRSVAEAAQALPGMAGDIDIIGYNLERGQATPASELADPVASVAAMRRLADAHGLELAFGPDHDLALSHGAQIAPLVDIFVLQIQRRQTEPRVAREFVIPMVGRLRAANPGLQISAQVRTEGDVQDLVALVESLSGELDGVSILTSPETVDVAYELVAALRPGAAITAPAGGPDMATIVAAVAAALLLVALVLFRQRRRATS